MTTELHVTARDIQQGDRFTLHGHEREALDGAWPAIPGHVHIPFVGGGDAVVPADRPVTVVRAQERAA